MSVIVDGKELYQAATFEAGPLQVGTVRPTVTITTAYASSNAGLAFDKASSDTADTQSVTWEVDGVAKWSVGLDIGNADLYLAFDWTIPGDTLRMSPTNSKLILGNGVGSPNGEGAQLTVVSNGAGGAQNLDLYAGRANFNSSLGLTLNQANAGTAAAARVQLSSNSVTANLETYSGSHSTRPNATWLYNTGDNPVLLGTNNAAVAYLLHGGLGTAGMAVGQFVASHGLEAGGAFDVCDGDLYIRSTAGGGSATRSLVIWPSWSVDPTNKLTISVTTGDKSIVSSSQLDLQGTGVMLVGNLGFYGTAPIAKAAVTGSKGGNVALASLMTALAALGLVTDSTT